MNLTDERNISEKDILTYIKHLQNEVKSNWIHFRSVLYLKLYFNHLEKEKTYIDVIEKLRPKFVYGKGSNGEAVQKAKKHLKIIKTICGRILNV